MFWEVMSSWAMWIALTHDGTPDGNREAFKYFLFNTVGASFMFLGFTLIAAVAGTFELAAIGRVLPGLRSPPSRRRWC